MRRLLLASALCFCTSALAQLGQVTPPQAPAPEAGPSATALTRTVRGRVLGPDGAPVPNAIVLIKNQKTLEVRSFIAANNGSYVFYGVSSDVNYSLRAQANGLSSPEKTVNVFDSHRVVKLDLKLKKPKKKKSQDGALFK